MQTIDLNKIIADNNLVKNDLAKDLFPNAKYPVLALNRILSDEALLDANQISKLAAVLNTNIDSIYNNSGWSNGRVVDNILVLTRDGIKAELNMLTFVTTLVSSTSMKHEFILSQPAITLKEYINTLNNEIQNL